MKERSQPRDVGQPQKSEQELMDMVDAMYESLGSDDLCGRLVEFKPEYEVLKDKKIVIVDDISDVLELFMPGYIVATNGNASAIRHSNQTREELANEIMAQHPDIVLMDYTLENNITGTQIMEMLKSKGYSGGLVGFSSEASRSDEFLQAGAIGSINKSASGYLDSISQLAELVKNS